MNLDDLNDEQRAAVTHPIGEPAVIIAGAGSGKCLTKGTLVLKYSGQVVPVETIQVGDLLMGPDSKPRKVLALGQGQDHLFKIQSEGGDAWGCNAAHIQVMSVRGAEHELTMEDFVSRPARFQRDARLTRTGVEFPYQGIPLSPYFVGIYLGSKGTILPSDIVGKALCPCATAFLESFIKPFIGHQLEELSGSWRIKIEDTSNSSLLGDLQALGLNYGSMIPECYKINSRETRKWLLAGLMDSSICTHLSYTLATFHVPYESLAHDITFLCRSLGFQARMSRFHTPGNLGYLIEVKGHMLYLPVKSEFKSSYKDEERNVQAFEFTWESLGYGDYFGFELDGDGRFLLGDFTVTHNTRVLTSRITWLTKQGVPPRKILALTFTNKAAGEIRERVAKEMGDTYDEKSGPRIGTIHSFALSAIRKDPKGFGLASRVSPLDDYGQQEMLNRIIIRHKLTEGDAKDAPLLKPWSVKDKIQYHRARGIGFAKDYTEEVHKAALKRHSGIHALNPTEIKCWELFEAEKKLANTLDFDDMLYLVVDRAERDEVWRSRFQSQFQHKLMDEAQDTNTCHPAGTRILVYKGVQRGSGKNMGSLMQEVNIEDLQNGDLVVAWAKLHCQVVKTGRPVTIGERHYKGDMLTCDCGGQKVPMTPDHKVYVCLNESPLQDVVYLMWQRHRGFWLGTCPLNNSIYGLKGHVLKGHPERIWFLSSVMGPSKAKTLIETLKDKYGLPEYSESLVSNLDGDEQGRACLAEFHRDFSRPLYRGGREVPPYKRWFETCACNLMPEIMSVPSQVEGKRLRVNDISIAPYEGTVYSLDVEEYHSYVANGVVVKNCQWRFFNLLFGENNHNAYVVGDMGQCQPPGTRVTLSARPLIERNIEDLHEGDSVLSWSRDTRSFHPEGRKIRVASRQYEGLLLCIHTYDKLTECTPHHWVWVRFSPEVQDKFLVCLMYQPDRPDFWTEVVPFTRLSHPLIRGGVSRVWILEVCDSQSEAEARAEAITTKYDFTNFISNPLKGMECLMHHRLLWTHPLISRGRWNVPEEGEGFFRTAAANILPGYMQVPTLCGCSTILTMSHRNYIGPVYSLNVDEHHTYVSDGIVVGNSIYGFNGAAPHMLKDFSEGWREHTPKAYTLASNYRSMPEIVNMANAIQMKMTETLPLKMKAAKDTQGLKGMTRLIRADTARNVAALIAKDIFNSNARLRNKTSYRDNAILVRSASHIRDIESELVRLRIPYIIRGGRGLLQTEEVRDILAYLRLAVNTRDSESFARASSVPRRGVGDAAIEKIRKIAKESFDGDLILASEKMGHAKLGLFNDTLRGIQRQTSPLDAFTYAVMSSGYTNYIKEKYGKKEPDKVTMKIENLGRLRDMINGILEFKPETTLEDLVFQFTLHEKEERKQEGDDDGEVVISTIHACVHPDTLIETPEGLQTIASVDDQGEVATPSGRGVYTNKFTYPERLAFRVFTENGYHVTVTPEHGMTSWKDGNLQRVEAKDLRQGDWLRLRLGDTFDPPQAPWLPPMYPAHGESLDTLKVPTVLTDAMAEILGFVLCCGKVTDTGFYVLSSNPEVWAYYRNLIQRVFNLSVRERMSRDGKSRCLEVVSKTLSHWMMSFGCFEPGHRDVPKVILQAPLKLQASFLRGLMEKGSRVDGKDAVVSRIVWGHKRARLVNTVQIMLLRFGIAVSREARIKDVDYHRFFLQGSNARLFGRSIGFISTAKQSLLEDATFFTKGNHACPMAPSDFDALGQAFPEAGSEASRQQGMITRKALFNALSRMKDVPAFVTERVEGWHYERVTAIEKVTCPSMCLEVPQGSRFLQNGFDGWNSKGLEWERVFVFNCYEGSIPHMLCREPNEIEEERRNFYVAVTRARREVAICVPGTLQRGPNFIPAQPSRFLIELGAI